MNLVWFRNDLRVQANPALEQAWATGEPCVALVCLTPQSWAEHRESAVRMGLWHARLVELQQELAELNIPLKVLNAQHFDDLPEQISELAQSLGIRALYLNREYPLNEHRRDQRTQQALAQIGVPVHSFDGELIIPPGAVRTGQGGPFKVYTPFSRAWRRALPSFDSAIKPLKDPLPESGHPSDPIPDDLGGYPLSWDSERWPADTAAIRARVYEFIDQREADYAEKRDFPAVDGTSRLSPYLTIGAISPKQLMHVQRAQYGDDRWLESSWLNELIWREFYRHLLVDFPGLSRLEPFRPDTEKRIRWRDDEAGFEAWKAGETGFPIVDAAMKQLLATGWMHNRLRMIVASFLTKLLGVDWRRGEAFFMDQLIDADFASNSGGWQWAASVGADAAPYFRIFNPTAQSEKFDPDGEFLVRWLPELSKVSPKQRHQPGAGQFYGRPAPIINYKEARARALDEYNSAG